MFYVKEIVTYTNNTCRAKQKGRDILLLTVPFCTVPLLHPIHSAFRSDVLVYHIDRVAISSSSVKKMQCHQSAVHAWRDVDVL